MTTTANELSASLSEADSCRYAIFLVQSAEECKNFERITQLIFLKKRFFSNYLSLFLCVRA